MASTLVVGGILLALAAVVIVVRRFWRWAKDSATSEVAPPPDRYSFGRLPTPADPVGPLGSMAPDADLSSDL